MTYSGQFLDVLIRSSKAGQADLLRELSKGWVSKQWYMTKQLMAHVTEITVNVFAIFRQKQN